MTSLESGGTHEERPDLQGEQDADERNLRRGWLSVGVRERHDQAGSTILHQGKPVRLRLGVLGQHAGGRGSQARLRAHQALARLLPAVLLPAMPGRLLLRVLDGTSTTHR